MPVIQAMQPCSPRHSTACSPPSHPEGHPAGPTSKRWTSSPDEVSAGPRGEPIQDLSVCASGQWASASWGEPEARAKFGGRPCPHVIGRLPGSILIEIHCVCSPKNISAGSALRRVCWHRPDTKTLRVPKAIQVAEMPPMRRHRLPGHHCEALKVGAAIRAGLPHLRSQRNHGCSHRRLR
jgi:hypothetical protein